MVKFTYEIPKNCPNCKALLKPEEVIIKGQHKVECPYCNSIIDLEVWI